jgi:hypothetical protein
MLPEGRGRLWYWFNGRTDSPWYSAVRLLARDGMDETEGWPPLIARCARDLDDWIKARTL